MLNFNHCRLRSPVIPSTDQEKDPFLVSVAFKKIIKAQFPIYPSMSLSLCAVMLADSFHGRAVILLQRRQFLFLHRDFLHTGERRMDITGQNKLPEDCNCALLPVSGKCQENHFHRRLDPAPMKITSTLTIKIFV